jgi:prepilin-type processing-associated H-X9-DG protein
MFAVGDGRLQPDAAFQGAPVLVGFDSQQVGLRSWPLLSQPERHGKGYNQVCCDGHVEGMPPLIMFSLSNSAPRWNNDHLPHREWWHSPMD